MENEVQRAPASAAQTHAQRVLVLDGSSEAHLHSMRPVLDSGHLGVAASSVETALSSMNEAMPGLVLCDPTSTGGWSACGRLSERLRKHEVPLVLLVEQDSAAELVEAGHQAGVDDCIVRPVRLHHITSRLSALVQREDGPGLGHHGSGRVVVVGREQAFVSRLDGVLERFGYRVLCVAPDHALSVAALVPPETDCLVLLCQDAASHYDELLAAFARRGNPPGKPPPPIVRVADAVGKSRPAEDSPAWLSADVFGLETILDLVSSHFHRHAATSPRLQDRAPLFCPVELRELDKPDAPWSSGYANDVGSGGICIRTIVPPRVRSCVDLRIHLATFREMIEVKCVVAWANPWLGRGPWSWQVGAGLQFLGMIPRPLSELTARCAEREAGAQPSTAG